MQIPRRKLTAHSHQAEPALDPLPETTGVWDLNSDLESAAETTPAAISERAGQPVKRSVRARIGHLAYWLRHAEYRAEVAEHACTLVDDLRAKMPPKLVVPHPRTRDFHNATDRRRHTGEFARDIVRYAEMMRYLNLAFGAMALFAVGRLEASHHTPLDLSGTDVFPAYPIPLKAVEVHLPVTDGQEPGDDDIITRIVPLK